MSSSRHLSHLNLIGSFNDFGQPRVILFKTYDPLAKGPDLFLAAVIVCLKGFLVNDASLLAELLVFLGQNLSVLLHLA